MRREKGRRWVIGVWETLFCDKWTKEKKLLRRRRSGGGGKWTARKKWPEGSQGWRELLGRSAVGSKQVVTLYLKVFQWHVLSELWMPRKGGKGQGQRLGASESLAVEEERSRQSYKGL